VKYDLLGEGSHKEPSPKESPSAKRTHSVRTQLKAPGSDSEDPDPAASIHFREIARFLTEDPIMQLLLPKVIGGLQGPVEEPQPPADATSALATLGALMSLMKHAGITPGAFDAEALFNLEIADIQQTTRSLFERLVPIVGRTPKDETKEPARSPAPTGTERSSRYASAESEVASDASSTPQRMTLGPSGVAMLRTNKERSAKETPQTRKPNQLGQLTLCNDLSIWLWKDS